MGTIEQRRNPRIAVEFFADWGWSPECEYYDRVTSLSVSGCFLATKRELDSGQEIFLRWKAEQIGSINVKGAVRYQLRVMEGAQPTGAGVEFVGVSGDILKKLQVLLESYDRS